ncbi:phosphoribosylglycinamide formyltransferase [bacterium]|nr:phosphoribosylglycinamide formyltransferase [bacterium]
MENTRIISAAVLLSGTGSTLQNLIGWIAAGKLPAKIAVVLSSKPDAYGVTRAKDAGIPVVIVNRKGFKNHTKFAQEVNDRLAKFDLDLIVLAGYSHLLLLDKLRNIPAINIHPALIPSFCGKGFYGDKVHKAVLEQGIKVTGVTVHFVDEEYDHGPIVLQEAVRVRRDDTIASLRSRVQRIEHRLYPEAIKLFAEGRLRVEGRKVIILPLSKSRK